MLILPQESGAVVMIGNADETLLKNGAVQQREQPQPGAQQEDFSLIQGQNLLTTDSRTALRPPPSTSKSQRRVASTFWDAFRSVGIVFGDIGTSPLYTFSAVFDETLSSATPPKKDDILGALSSVIWLLFLVVSVKYCLFVLSADYQGHGGILALYRLVVKSPGFSSEFQRKVLASISCLTLALFIAVAVITPSITSLSAVEGVITVGPEGVGPHIPKIALGVLLIVFAFQYKGSSKLGFLTAPIILTWLTVLAATGLYHLCRTAHVSLIASAFNPIASIKWLSKSSPDSSMNFLMKSNVILAVTGAESIFATFAHFGKRPVVLSWYLIVLPCLLLQYCGQAAYLLSVSDDASLFQSSRNDGDIVRHTSVFWASIPKGSVVYKVQLVIATLATVVASQAAITGSFTLLSQAANLGFFPSLRVSQTNSKVRGQVFISKLNMALCVATLFTVLFFDNSGRLEVAYGCAVAFVFVLTTITVFGFVAQISWKYSLLKSLPLLLLYLVVEGMFLVAYISEFLSGAWFALFIAVLVLGAMGCWVGGERLAHEGTLSISSTLISSIMPTSQSENMDDNQENSSSQGIRPAVRSSLMDSNLILLKAALSKDLVVHSNALGVYFTSTEEALPTEMLEFFIRTATCPRWLILLTIKGAEDEAYLPLDQKIRVKFLDEGKLICSITILKGWLEPLFDVSLCEYLTIAGFFASSVPLSQSNTLHNVHVEESTHRREHHEIFDILRSLTLSPDGMSAKIHRSSTLQVFSTDQQFLRDTFTQTPVLFAVTSKTLVPKENRSIWIRAALAVYNWLKLTFHESIVDTLHIPQNNVLEIHSVLKC